MELCLFDDDGRRAPGRPWSEVDAHRPGTPTCPGSARDSATATGCTARGTPHEGARCNPAKLLLDPYARAVDGAVAWDPACFRYDCGDPEAPQRRDSAPYVPTVGRAQPVLRLGQRPAPAIRL